MLLGHAAFSPAHVGDNADWIALGPISVTPERQRQGVGSNLLDIGIAQIKASGATGVVLMGSPAFYSRFGFVAEPALRYRGKASQYLQTLSFGAKPAGDVRFHQAFGE